MSETTNPTAEGAVPQGTTTTDEPAWLPGANEPMNEFERMALETPNSDLVVPLRDSIFEGKIKVEIVKPEPVRGEGDDKSLGVRVSYKFLQEAEAKDPAGKKVAPGFLLRPRPFTIRAKDGKSSQATEIALRDLNKLLIAAGLSTYRDELKGAQVIGMAPKLEGKQIVLDLRTREDRNKKGDDGKPLVYQDIRFQAVGEAAGNGAGPSEVHNI